MASEALRRVCAVVPALFLMAGPALAARAQQQPPQQQSPQQQSPPPPATATDPTASAADLFSIDRIRKELGRQPAITSTTPDPNLPIYRLRVDGYRFQLPTWQENHTLPQSSWIRQPFGGADYYEMQRLITPPQAWGSAPFSNGDVFGMLQAQLVSAAANALIKKGLEAHKNAAPARAHAEVQQELAELEAHNARVAAGLPDGDGDAKTSAEKKKQDEEKKKQEEAKKKKKKEGK